VPFTFRLPEERQLDPYGGRKIVGGLNAKGYLNYLRETNDTNSTRDLYEDGNALKKTEAPGS
jgi:hypothetical protein